MVNPDVVLLPIWGVVTFTLIILLLYHFVLTHQSRPMGCAAPGRPGRPPLRTQQAQQATIDRKAKKITWSIVWLGMLSAVLLLAMMGVWVSRNISA